jgi:UDP-N-acetylmuramate dehydrogenase
MILPERGEIEIIENLRLADFTTLKLGGDAKYYVECTTVQQIFSALEFARRNGIRLHVLGGGSNTIFLDEGFDGLVLRIGVKGIQFVRDQNEVRLSVAAGESWDDFVQSCIQKNLAGIECLSGIPGLVGAAPIQNVGAYGQEVSETIVAVKAIDRESLQEVRFTNADCNFAYRRSRFNSEDTNRFIMIEVTFRLREFHEPQLRYPELKKFIEASVDLKQLSVGKGKLQAVRDAVISLRRKKSMVNDDADPNSRSVGSFFKNPLLTKTEFQAFEQKCRANGYADSIPTFAAGANVKVPAAWLVEQAGFRKGFQRNGVGVSTNHSLALINIAGTSRELLALAGEIQSVVFQRFGLQLEREPVVVH